MSVRGWIGSIVLLGVIAAGGMSLTSWKAAALDEAAALSANQPEPVESVTLVEAREVGHVDTTTSIGTVLALRSITLRNELAGTVRQVMLMPGEIVEEGTVLVALDVAVEQADLDAQLAEAALAETLVERMERLSREDAVPELDLHRAIAERDVGLAGIARTRAIIDRKTIRAPFRARVGIADVHPGQYLNEGTELTTLQGVDQAAHVDFTVSQQVAGQLREGARVDVYANDDRLPIAATILAIDARVDPVTRNATVRARIDSGRAPAPGASVRVRVPVGPRLMAVAVPVSALRKGPGGDHVFVVREDESGVTRASVRLVETGSMLGDEVLIHSGLSVGERIASVGSFKLREGVLVAAVGAPDPSVVHSGE